MLASPLEGAAAADLALSLDRCALPFQLETPPTSVWPSSIDAQPLPEAAGDVIWTTYNDALWLGEVHTSFVNFVKLIQKLASFKGMDVARLFTRLAMMIRPRSLISQRFNHEAGQKLAHCNSGGGDVDVGASLSMLYPDHHEAGTVQVALRGGPANVVLQEIRARPVTAPLGDLGARVESHSFDKNSNLNRWLRAIERRELQLQVLLTLLLLQMTAHHGPCVEVSKRALAQRQRENEGMAPTFVASSMTDAESATDAREARPKKRSRKLERPRRWNAELGTDLHDDHFLWQKKPDRKRKHEPSNNDSEGVLELTAGEAVEPEQLNRRLEALVDILSLGQMTEGLASELGQLFTGLDDETTKATTQKRTKIDFGTAARPRDLSDQLDDVQWLCKHVVEPCFGETLPHQCTLLKSKCFVSGLSGTTPVRPRATKADRSAEHSGLPASDRSRAKAPFREVTRPRLRDVLELEETSGRRTSRGGSSVASQTMFGRGREVDMDRRFARSVSAGSSILAAHLGSETANGSYHAPLASGDTGGDSNAARAFITGKLGKRKSEAVRRPAAKAPSSEATPAADPADSSNSESQLSSKQALVFSTPSKARTVFHQPKTRPTSFANSLQTVKPLQASLAAPSFGSSVGTAFRRTESQPFLPSGGSHNPIRARTQNALWRRHLAPSLSRPVAEDDDAADPGRSRSPSPIAILSGSASEGEQDDGL